MPDTPSGNRWEPAADETRPLAHPGEAAAPAAAENGEESADTPGGPGGSFRVFPVDAPPPHAAPRPRSSRGRAGLLAGGALAVLLGAGAGGYAIGSATADQRYPGIDTTRQGPGGVDPGQGLPGRPPGDDDHDGVGGPGDGNGSGDDSDGGTE
jgi:hypothetical protein